MASTLVLLSLLDVLLSLIHSVLCLLAKRVMPWRMKVPGYNTSFDSLSLSGVFPPTSGPNRATVILSAGHSVDSVGSDYGKRKTNNILPPRRCRISGVSVR